ncbi:MAG: MoaD/ThiS family protein [Actinomycetia bacterium]|nr:MoaD/ThiS family protein [Actinomycetes bacterium]
MGVTVTVRYWAGSRRAAGCAEELLTASTAGQLRRMLAGRDSLSAVMRVASLLIDGIAAADDTVLPADATVDVLPPFAGG